MSRPPCRSNWSKRSGPVALLSAGHCNKAGGSGTVVERFGFIDRLAYWLTAVSFIILGPTGLNTLTYEATIHDPAAYPAPWTIRCSITPRTASSWIENGEIFEYICQDDRNEDVRGN